MKCLSCKREVSLEDISPVCKLKGIKMINLNDEEVCFCDTCLMDIELAFSHQKWKEGK